jgi:hypothetical protein
MTEGGRKILSRSDLKKKNPYFPTPSGHESGSKLEKSAFQDLEKELAALDFSKEFQELEEQMKKVDFSDLERRLQEIDLDFLLQ